MQNNNYYPENVDLINMNRQVMMPYGYGGQSFIPGMGGGGFGVPSYMYPQYGGYGGGYGHSHYGGGHGGYGHPHYGMGGGHGGYGHPHYGMGGGYGQGGYGQGGYSHGQGGYQG